MGKIQIPQKIRIEDFKSDEQELISKIAGTYNSFADDVYSTLDKRIDESNLNQQTIDITVKINAAGLVINSPQIRTTVNGKIAGLVVLNAINQANPGVYPTSQPFINWTINGNILTILNISGLQANSEYKLTVRIYV